MNIAVTYGRDPCTSHLCTITLYHAHAHPLRTVLIVRPSCPCLVPTSPFSLPSCLAILEAYARVLVIPRPPASLNPFVTSSHP